MRALKIIARGQLRIDDVPIPSIAPDEVLIKVAGAGLCHSDLHVMHAPTLLRYGMTLGHETAGFVTEMGADVTGFAEGDPVLVCLVWACGECRPCLEGRDNVCVNNGGRLRPPPAPGLGPDGGMADYIVSKARYLEPLGDLDPVIAGPLGDAALTPMHAINGARHRLGPDATVVAIGIGGLGHMGLQILKATTDARVIAIDSSPQRLAAATALGADIVIPSGDDAAQAILDLTGGYGADAIFDFVGLQATIDIAGNAIAPDGALRLVGLGGGKLSMGISMQPLPWGVDVRRSYGGTRADQRQVLDLAAAGTIGVDAVRYSLDDGLQAFADLEAGVVAGRAILVP
ncbi:MAG: dehydrogenase [Pseudonocardiales bacterium]|nr:dehydrogenase [Pseudonocardiales bacterium]